jgi:hypothetical protein
MRVMPGLPGLLCETTSSYGRPGKSASLSAISECSFIHHIRMQFHTFFPICFFDPAIYIGQVVGESDHTDINLI